MRKLSVGFVFAILIGAAVISSAQTSPSAPGAMSSPTEEDRRTPVTSAEAADTPTLGPIREVVPPPHPQHKQTGIGKMAVSARLSTLGVGAEFGIGVGRTLNVRTGFDAFAYTLGFEHGGVPYTGHLSLGSLHSQLDWFPLHGALHISPGVLFNNNDHIRAVANITPGSNFELNSVSYYSSSQHPVQALAHVTFNHIAPMVTLGYGNLIPRSGKHFSFPFEAGVVFQGEPQTPLNVTGYVCDVARLGCRDIANDPTAQKNVAAERDSYRNKLSVLRYYPVVSMGVSYKF